LISINHPILALNPQKGIAMKKLILLLLPLFLSIFSEAQNTYREITLPALMKKYQQDPSNIVIVDVRSDGEYYDSAARFKSGNIGRIKGVKHIDVQDLNKPESLKLLEPYKDKEIYLLCSHSYRSRNASNVLIRNGFNVVYNVQGGMTEWYRRYDELLPYRSALETSVRYKNISSAQLYELISKKTPFVFIGINILPRTFFDSATLRYLSYYPTFKNAVFFNESDSAKILELAKKNAGKPIVLFNNFSNGAAEMADYLAGEGIQHVQYLVGGISYFMEYATNNNLENEAVKMLTSKNNIRFVSAGYACDVTHLKVGQPRFIDIRIDTLFNKVNRGIKNDYTHLQRSANFPFSKGAAEFEKTYPDKKQPYLLISRNGNEGIELADQLSKNGYHIYWMIGGIARYDWYTINEEPFFCKGELLTQYRQ
jgi:rhodanese-related sulfurtransferase